MDAYTKGETLGSGTFGVVYKATHKEVRRRWGMRKEQREGEGLFKPAPPRVLASLTLSTPLLPPRSP